MTASIPTLVAEARLRRLETLTVGRRRSAFLAASIITCWFVAVVSSGQLARVFENSPAAVTMIFGSFVAGSTPQGGGAVAFPVLTKLLGVTTADARTFSLSIQAVGMGSAAAIIALTGRAVDRRALRLTVPSAIAGFLGGSALFSAISLPATYLKVVFTLAVVAAGAATWLSRRTEIVEHLLAAPLDTVAHRRLVIAAATGGGVASALFGSGADIAVYVLLTIVLGVRPSVGVATSVITMASVSVVGLALALGTGQMQTSVSAVDGADVFGMWLAAVPIVVVGAPTGSWFASRVSAATLARFIAVLAALELVSTVVFLDELRTDPLLAGTALAGLLATGVGVRRIITARERVAAARPHLTGSLRRIDLELGAAR